MNRPWLAAASAATMLLSAPPLSEPAMAFVAGSPQTPGPVSDQVLLVRLAPGASLAWDHSGPVAWRAGGERDAAATAVLSQLAMISIEPVHRGQRARPVLAAAIGLDRDVVIRLAGSVDTRHIAGRLREFSGVFEHAEPAAIGSLSDHVVEVRGPNDPLLPQQYALENVGQSILGRPGLSGADVDAFDAWEHFVPQRQVVVAVVDSGVHPHPDLPALLPGWNVPLNNAQTGDEYASHGTHLAGLIAARHGNGIGIAGVAPWAGLMPVKVTNTFGNPGVDWVAAGIVWAADHGADIVNVSIGFEANNTALHAAVQYAAASGCLVVCSAGNQAGGPIVAPARYPEALAVGATDNRDGLAPFSSMGPELDLVAPGRDVLSTWHQFFSPNTYEYRSGTSQAAPIVSGVAALVMMANPALAAPQVRQILSLACEDLGEEGWDPMFGAGRIDAARAVLLARAWGAPASARGAVSPACRADIDRNGTLSTNDYFLFLEYYARGDARADFAAPWGVINGSDFFAYNTEYARGCGLP